MAYRDSRRHRRDGGSAESDVRSVLHRLWLLGPRSTRSHHRVPVRRPSQCSVQCRAGHNRLHSPGNCIRLRYGLHVRRSRRS